MSAGVSAPRVLVDARKARDFGIGRYVVGLLGSLARRGDFALYAVARRDDLPFLPQGVTPVLSEAPNYSLAELVAVRGAIRAVAPDLFHAPHYVVPLFPPRATVVTVHDLMHLNRPEHAAPLKRAYASVMVRRAVRLASRVIAGSEATRAELTAFDADAAGKCRVISYGVDARFLSEVSREERARVRAAHGLGSPYVLFLGNDKPHKNVEGLLAAFGRLRGKGLAHRLVLAGGAPERLDARRAAAAAHGLADAVADLGVVPDADVPPLLAEADALVLPSFAEGFGLPALEAQAVGTAVVCSDRGGLKEAAGDAALYVDPENPASIADALERVLVDEGLRRRLSAAGRARSRAFTWDAVAEKTAAVYQEVLGARP